FRIDVAYEAQRNGSFASWVVLRGNERLGLVHTWVAYNSRDDTFELHSGPRQTGTAPQIELAMGPLKIRVTEMKGMYRVTREGKLREMKGSAVVDIKGRGIAELLGAQAHFEVAGGGEVKA